MSLRTLTFFAAWASFAVCSAIAQDPFGDFGDPPDSLVNQAENSRARSEATAGSVDVKERDAVVLSLRREPPQNAIGMAKAVRWMTRIRRWDEAGRWLERLDSVGITPALAVEIAEAIGSKSLFELESQQPGLTELQKATVVKIRQMAMEASQDPQNLQTRILQLRSESRGERLSAFEAIKASGNAGIKAMLNHLLTEGCDSPNNAMIETFALLGDHATRAWQTAMTTPHFDAKARLIELVAAAPKPKMGCELMAEVYDPTVPQTIRNGLTRLLSRADDGPPSPETAHQYAMQLVESSLIDYKRRTRLNEVDTEISWSLDPTGRSLSESMVVPANLSLQRASQAGRLALRLSTQTELADANAVAAHWEWLAVSGASDAAQDDVFQFSVPAVLRDSHEFACLIWDAAVQGHLYGAQAIAVANLSRWEGVGLPEEVRSRLVAATRSGVPVVRYGAAQALMKTILEIEGTPNNEAASNEMVAKFGRFNGSSRLETVGREMRQLAMEPTALIVGGHEDLRGHMHGLLDQFGYRFFEAASAAETFTLLRSEIPIDTVFIVHHVREMDLGQLIQRLRANPVTSSVPIALLADSLSRGEHALADEDHRVVVGSVPPSIDGLTDIVARLRAVTDPPLLSQEARVIFKETAENFFQRVGSPPRNKAPHTGGTLLASSREEQNHLLRIATDASEAEAKRKQASQNFVQSVRRFGLLITTETAQEQYDVYNLRGESEPVTRAVMGRILDAIEASNGQRAWSEVSP
jgi:CheY-like chemotaxis protein